MQAVGRLDELRDASRLARMSLAFCAATFALVAAAAVGSFPLQASIITIFLFAGAHNFMEFRYFLARMPVRWGRSRSYYLFAIAGTVALAASYIAIYFVGGSWLWTLASWETAVSLWNTGFILWIGALFYLRGRMRPGSDWTPAIAVALFVAGLAWLLPSYWSLSLVYLHPLVALWFADRQIRRSKPRWLAGYRLGLVSVPLMLVLLYAWLSQAPDLPTETSLFWRIAQHAGASVLPGFSTHFLVASHVFLETLHYAAWIVLIPVVDRRAVPWNFRGIPLFASKDGIPRIVAVSVAVSALMVLMLWAGFSLDYTLTRDIYFGFAIAHVIAEIPFLVKML